MSRRRGNNDEALTYIRNGVIFLAEFVLKALGRAGFPGAA
jgi:hypothetical protein